MRRKQLWCIHCVSAAWLTDQYIKQLSSAAEGLMIHHIATCWVFSFYFCILLVFCFLECFRGHALCFWSNVTSDSIVCKWQLWCLFFQSVIWMQEKKQHSSGSDAVLLVFSGIVSFFLDHCKQQQAALDLSSEELVISPVISHVYNMCSAVRVEELEGGEDGVKRNIYCSKRSRLFRDVKTA